MQIINEQNASHVEKTFENLSYPTPWFGPGKVVVDPHFIIRDDPTKKCIVSSHVTIPLKNALSSFK